jgi:hypothetical protein
MALINNPRISAYGLNIKPSAGALCYIYEAGTTTPKTTYSVPALTAGYEQSHPVVADSRGVFAAMYIDGTYKIVIKDSAGATIYTDDNQVGGAGNVQIKGDFDSTTNSSNYPVSGDQGDLYRVTETFTLAAASGSHEVVNGDIIIANKNGAAALDADWDIYLGGGSRQFVANFDIKNLLLNVYNTTKISVTFDSAIFHNSNGEIREVGSDSDYFDTATDLSIGTTIKSSHWYALWEDSDKTKEMIIELQSAADADVANSLSDSAATFQTDNVTAGDIVYNLTDYTSGFIGAVSSETVCTIVDTDGDPLDLFPDGNEDYKIHQLNTTKLNAFANHIGYGYVDASEHLTGCGYTRPELQNKISYSQQAGDYTLTLSGVTFYGGTNLVYQVFDFGMTPQWRGILEFYGEHSSTMSSDTVTQTGVTYLNVTTYRQMCVMKGGGASITLGYFNSNTNTITFTLSSSCIRIYCNTHVIYENKPTFATRS